MNANNKSPGLIPDSLFNILTLKILKLEHNKLSGSISPALAQLKNLTNLNLSYNSLTGRITNIQAIK